MAGKKRRKKPQPGRRPAVVVEPDRRAAALLAAAGPCGVPAEASRRRLRIGYAVLGVATASGVVVPALLERAGAAHDGAQFAGALTGLVGACVLGFLHVATRSVSHGPDLRWVTARTLTGVRTLDLTALVRIRRCRFPGRYRGWDDLWLIDARGVSLRLDEPEVIARVAALLAPPHSGEPVADGPATATARVSHHAAVRLGLATRSHLRRVARGCFDWLLAIYLPGAAALLGLLATWLLATV
ncbi:hypothetical protein GCM10009665_22000 [Kitasatospora nipponensis]|uniref:PH (Pleckstrin Homology) domain-containing protein n=1 Tax=Kitasatospora nipponensis TaxID=258049 RepID=A0ABP4GQ56_9ACTN